MKAGVYSLEGEKIGEVELPAVFQAKIREDIIRRVFTAQQTAKKQPKGTDPLAGNRRVAFSLGTGRGLSRVPRIQGSLRAAKISSAVGGRKAHPPRAEKKIRERVNKKERKKATFSSIAATAHKTLVEKRGHIVNGVKEIPLIVSNEIEEINKTSEVREAFIKLGLWGDVERCRKRWRKERAGKGKTRGRKRKGAKGPLIIVKEGKGIRKAARCLPGVDVRKIRELSCEDLAPGGHPGRLTVWSKLAIEWLKETVEG